MPAKTAAKTARSTTAKPAIKRATKQAPKQATEQATKQATKAAAAPPDWRFRMRVTAGDEIAVGPGKIALLEAIAKTGSITAAAKSLDMSYRRAWLLVDELNRSLRQPAVDSAKGGQAGGGTALTEVGQQLIALYRGIEVKAADACRTEIRQVMKLLAR